MNPLSALIRHQLRLLAQNRCACLVLVMLAIVAAIGQRVTNPGRGVCYIVYWQDDPWIEQLRAELPSINQSFEVELRPVRDFVGPSGIIEYPDGAHSIQLRPPTEQQDHWLVWFWYSGERAEVLNPIADWFWSATQGHFDAAGPIRARVSSLRSSFAWLDVVGPTVRAFVKSGDWKAPMVWLALFFCGSYLPAIALAQQREDRTILTLVTAPTGWNGIAVATAIFYFVLAAVMGGSLAIAIEAGSIRSLPAIFVGAAIYVAVGLTVGCLCQSTASASSGLLVYLLFSGLAAIALQLLSGLSLELVSVERGLLTRFSGDTTLPILPWSLIGWGLFWLLISRRCFNDMQRSI